MAMVYITPTQRVVEHDDYVGKEATITAHEATIAAQAATIAQLEIDLDECLNP